MTTKSGPSYRQSRKFNPKRLAIPAVSSLAIVVSGGLGYIAYDSAKGMRFSENREIPVISSPGSLWVKPVDQGGKEASFVDQPVNELVEGGGFDLDKLQVVTFASPPVELPDDARSLNERGIRLEQKDMSAEGDAPLGKSAQDILAEFFAAYDQEQADPQKKRALTRQQDSIATTGRQRAPEDIARGTIMVYLGSYPDQTLAKNRWLEFQGTYRSLMGNKDWTILRFDGEESITFRLHGLGFSMLADAQELCNRIRAGGYLHCTPTTMK